MNKREFESFFRSEILPSVRARFEQDGIVDHVARNEEWNTIVDMMVQDGELPQRAVNWVSPW